MYEGLWEYAIPAMIVMVFVNFFWAMILTAVRPPAGAGEKAIPAMVHPQWTVLDAGPQGIRKNIMQGIQPQTKTV